MLSDSWPLHCVTSVDVDMHYRWWPMVRNGSKSVIKAASQLRHRLSYIVNSPFLQRKSLKQTLFTRHLHEFGLFARAVFVCICTSVIYPILINDKQQMNGFYNENKKALMAYIIRKRVKLTIDRKASCYLKFAFNNIIYSHFIFRRDSVNANGNASQYISNQIMCGRLDWFHWEEIKENTV